MLQRKEFYNICSWTLQTTQFASDDDDASHVVDVTSDVIGVASHVASDITSDIIDVTSHVNDVASHVSSVLDIVTSSMNFWLKDPGTFSWQDDPLAAAHPQSVKVRLAEGLHREAQLQDELMACQITSPVMGQS